LVEDIPLSDGTIGSQVVYRDIEWLSWSGFEASEHSKTIVTCKDLEDKDSSGSIVICTIDEIMALNPLPKA
jgi:hypothetical protein